MPRSMSIKLIRTVLLTAIHPAPTETESPTPIHPTIARRTSDTATRSQKTEEGTRIPPTDRRTRTRTGGSRAEEEI